VVQCKFYAINPFTIRPFGLKGSETMVLYATGPSGHIGGNASRRSMQYASVVNSAYFVMVHYVLVTVYWVGVWK